MALWKYKLHICILPYISWYQSPSFFSHSTHNSCSLTQADWFYLFLVSSRFLFPIDSHDINYPDQVCAQAPQSALSQPRFPDQFSYTALALFLKEIGNKTNRSKSWEQIWCKNKIKAYTLTQLDKGYCTKKTSISLVIDLVSSNVHNKWCSLLIAKF